MGAEESARAGDQHPHPADYSDPRRARHRFGIDEWGGDVELEALGVRRPARPSVGTRIAVVRGNPMMDQAQSTKPRFASVKPLAQAPAVCATPLDARHYGAARINVTTLARVATAAATWAKILEFHGDLASDDYVRYVDAFYRDNVRRFGKEWHYLDIVNVLFAAAKAVEPRLYLEVGVRRGRSACTVVRACPSVDIIAIDMWTPNYAGMDNPGPAFVEDELACHGHTGGVVFMNGNSHLLLPRLFAAKPELRFDLITVDGDHSEAGAYRDLADVVPHLAPGGVLVFDDICHPSHPYLLEVWRRVVMENKCLSAYEYTEQGYGVGFAVRKA
ncbi:MAG: class I SAM-dependent methyltransferase [Myxococcales bacterium]|nr:class I SAM-dependent methyltransferase [Myxococcales bacterium]